MTEMKNAKAGRERRKRSRLLTAAGAACLLAFAVILFAVSGGIQKMRTASILNGDGILSEDWIVQDLLPVNDCSRPGEKLTWVNAIVVHYVGNPGTTAQQNRDYFASLAETEQAYASSNFVIGLDGEVIQCVPINEVAYCSNDRNGDTISIECCHPDESGVFTQETYASLVRLLRTLCDRFGLKEDDIIRHYDVTGKLCPLYYVEHEDAWLQLKEDVFS